MKVSKDRIGWMDVEDCTDVNQMVTVFNSNIASALNKVAPIKTFKVRSNHRFGLSETTKELIKKRVV